MPLPCMHRPQCRRREIIALIAVRRIRIRPWCLELGVSRGWTGSAAPHRDSEARSAFANLRRDPSIELPFGITLAPIRGPLAIDHRTRRARQGAGSSKPRQTSVLVRTTHTHADKSFLHEMGCSRRWLHRRLDGALAIPCTCTPRLLRRHRQRRRP